MEGFLFLCNSQLSHIVFLSQFFLIFFKKPLYPPKHFFYTCIKIILTKNTLKKTLFFLTILFSFSQLSAQTQKFSYAPKSLDSLKTYLTKVTTNKIQSFDKSCQKKAKEIHEASKEEFIKGIKDSTYIFDKELNNSLNKILSEIYKANPQIDHKDFYFLIDVSPIPNAACYGNGIFTINLGLFSMVENEDELAYIMCHEFSHYLLKHGDKSLTHHIQTFNSKDTKQKINKAASLEYGRRAAVSEVLKNLGYSFKKRSRNDEIQADSLGLILFKKTRYNLEASITGLKKLDMADDMLYSNPTNLKNVFSFETYPFKDRWITPEGKLFDIKEKADDYQFDKDSLKTHPDVPLRIENLKKNFNINATANTTTEILKIQKRIIENSVKIYTENFKLDFTLYQLLALRQRELLDDNQFYSATAYILKKSYQLKENHTFGKHSSQVSPFSDKKNYDEIKLFLNNLELKELRKLGLYFCQKNEAKVKDDPVFKDAYTFFQKLNTI